MRQGRGPRTPNGRNEDVRIENATATEDVSPEWDIYECHTCRVRSEQPAAGAGKLWSGAWLDRHAGHRVERIA